MMTRHDTAIRNCLHVVFDPYRDGGTGLTAAQQSAWLAAAKVRVRQMIEDHIAHSEECKLYRGDYEILEANLGKAVAPRLIVVARFDGLAKWGKRDATATLTAAWKAMQPLLEPLGELSPYIYATATPGEASCIAAADVAFRSAS